MTLPILLIHGGAGAIERTAMTPELEADFRAALAEVLRIGETLLAGGVSSLDVVERAVVMLEDNPLFNAGRGAVFNAAGRHELEASVMDGATRKAGGGRSLCAQPGALGALRHGTFTACPARRRKRRVVCAASRARAG